VAFQPAQLSAGRHRRVASAVQEAVGDNIGASLFDLAGSTFDLC
jgi:hypothetical protein